MKKIFLCFILSLSLFGCSTIKKEPYQEIALTADELKEKIENKETFNFMVIRDGCEYCNSLEEYVEETKDEHPDIILYTLDSTDFDFSRENEDDTTLISSTDDGKYLLSICPYFLYTPTIYCVDQGEIITTGIGFNATKKTVSIWDNGSTIDFDTADTVNFWDFIS